MQEFVPKEIGFGKDVIDFKRVVELIEVDGLIRNIAGFGNYYESCSCDLGFPLTECCDYNKHSPV